MKFLSDSWCIRGTDLEEFRNAVCDLDLRTSAYSVSLDSVELLTPHKSDGDFIRFVSSNPEGGGKIFDIKKALSGGTPLELIEEMKRVNLMLAIESAGNQQVYFASAGLYRDLGARAGLVGDGLRDSTRERNAFLAARYKKVKGYATAVIREDDGIGKVFALASTQYAHVKQRILYAFIKRMEKELGEAEVIRWHIDHNLTWIMVRFPEKAADIAATYGHTGIKFPMPGMLLETSDTGFCSLTVSSIWEMPSRSSYVKAETYSRKHYGSVDAESFQTEVTKNVWSTYTLLPERLCELALINVDDPKELVQKIFQTKIGKNTLFDIVGKRDAKGIIEALCVEFNPAISYTAYDVAMTLMTLPERLVDPTRNRNNDITKTVYRVPFMDFEKMMAKKTVILSPV